MWYPLRMRFHWNVERKLAVHCMYILCNCLVGWSGTGWPHSVATTTTRAWTTKDGVSYGSRYFTSYFCVYFSGRISALCSFDSLKSRVDILSTFGGILTFSMINFFLCKVIKRMRVPEDDFRNILFKLLVESEMCLKISRSFLL